MEERSLFFARKCLWRSCRAVEALRLVARHFHPAELILMDWTRFYPHVQAPRFVLIRHPDSSSSLPRRLYHDPSWEVLSVMLAENGVLVCLKRRCSDETSRAHFKCPLCLCAASAAREGALVEGSRVRITEEGHHALASVGTLTRCGPWAVRLEDQRTVTVRDVSSLELQPGARLCQHFVGGQRMGFWAARQKHSRRQGRGFRLSTHHAAGKGAKRSSHQVSELDRMSLSGHVLNPSCARRVITGEMVGESSTAGSDWTSPPVAAQPTPWTESEWSAAADVEDAAINEFGELMDMLGYMQCGEI